MDIGKLIGNLVAIGLLLATLGTLVEVTNSLKKSAAEDTKRGMFSLGVFNRRLHQAK